MDGEERTWSKENMGPTYTYMKETVKGGLIRIQDQEEGCWRLKSWSVVSWISCSSAWTFADEDDDDKEIGSRLRMEFVFVVCLVAVVDDFELKDLLSLILPSKSIFTEKRAQTGL